MLTRTMHVDMKIIQLNVVLDRKIMFQSRNQGSFDFKHVIPQLRIVGITVSIS